MMKRFYYGVFMAVAMLMSTMSFADTYSGDGMFSAEPAYCSAVLLNTDPPMVPAAKPNNDGVADFGNDGFRRSLTVGYFQITPSKIPKPVLACGTSNELSDTPTKVPIAI